MKQNVIKALLLLGSIVFIAYIFIEQNPNKPEWALVISLLINIISAPIYFVVVEAIYSAGRIKLFGLTKLWYRNQQVRMSISYLFRIKVKGKYLLVKNRTGSYYQLVGGAYKTLPSSQHIFKKYNVKPDRKYETTNGIAKSDLRFMVPGKYVINMIDWFHSQKDREICQWREFCEELLTPGILDKHIFRYIDFSYSYTLQTPLKKAKGADYQEILIYEIYDLVPNPEQEAYLEQLFDQGESVDIKWADPIIIRSLGFNEIHKSTEYEIGAHTKWAIDEKWTSE